MGHSTQRTQHPLGRHQLTLPFFLPYICRTRGSHPSPLSYMARPLVPSTGPFSSTSWEFREDFLDKAHIDIGYVRAILIAAYDLTFCFSDLSERLNLSKDEG